MALPATQVTGSLRLRSLDPKESPKIDPNFLSHPFDQRLAIEAIRETLQFLSNPVLKSNHISWAAGPVGIGDEDILVRGAHESD